MWICCKIILQVKTYFEKFNIVSLIILSGDFYRSDFFSQFFREFVRYKTSVSYSYWKMYRIKIQRTIERNLTLKFVKDLYWYSLYSASHYILLHMVYCFTFKIASHVHCTKKRNEISNLKSESLRFFIVPPLAVDRIKAQICYPHLISPFSDLNWL